MPDQNSFPRVGPGSAGKSALAEVAQEFEHVVPGLGLGDRVSDRGSPKVQHPDCGGDVHRAEIGGERRAGCVPGAGEHQVLV
jgi:hypothetical protein